MIPFNFDIGDHVHGRARSGRIVDRVYVRFARANMYIVDDEPWHYRSESEIEPMPPSLWQRLRSSE